MVQRPHASKEKRYRVCVFCGSSPGDDKAFARAASRLGELIAGSGMDLVFGGGNVGLMGEVAREAHAGGAAVYGILPAFLRHLEPPLKTGEKVQITPDLQTRKGLMLSMADAFVILPGGLGTLDEFFEVLTSAQLSVLGKPIVVLNTKGYFEPLRALIDHVIRHGFARESAAGLCTYAATPEAVIKAITPPAVSSARKTSPRPRSARVLPKRSRT